MSTHRLSGIWTYTTSYDGTVSRRSRPITSRKTSRNGVPPGTVASRVQFLQSLQETPETRSPSPIESHDPSEYRRENSRSGFGRRLTKRFGRPAIRARLPGGDAHLDTAHSFLGLHTPHNTHKKEHGLGETRFPYSQLPGINGVTTQPPPAVTQYDAAAPLAGLSRKKARSMGRKQNTNDTDGQQKSVGNPPHDDHAGDKAPNDSLPAQDNQPKRPRQVIRTEVSDTFVSEHSYVTTSSDRRHQVRELFEDHGIERPEGLASSQGSSPTVKPAPYSAQNRRQCHQCSWVNNGPQTQCWRCGHQLCAVCDAQSPKSAVRNEPSLSYYERRLKSRQEEPKPAYPSTQRTQDMDAEPVEQASARPRPTPLQPVSDPQILQPQKETEQGRNRSGNPQVPASTQTYQASHPAKASHQPSLSSRASASLISATLHDLSRLVSDATAKNICIALLPDDQPQPTNGRIKYQYHRHQHNDRRRLQRMDRSSSSSHGDYCQRSSCQRSQCDDPAHRQIRLRAKREGQQHINEVTDHGYVADSSRVEDDQQPHLQKVLPRQRPSIFSFLQHESKESDLQKPCHHAKHIEDPNDISEYVECYGYPRTGHTRHESRPGLAGVCQHCISEDCQCAACQSTHHVVRCCTHKDHEAMVHHHHSPRKGSVNNLGVLPLSPSRRTSLLAMPIATTPRQQGADQESTNAPNVAQEVPSRLIKSTRPSLEKLKTLRLTRSSIFLSEAAKTQLPPSWVSTPRNALLKPVLRDAKDKVDREKPSSAQRPTKPATRDPYASPTKRSLPYSNHHRVRSSGNVKVQQSDFYQSHDNLKVLFPRTSYTNSRLPDPCEAHLDKATRPTDKINEKAPRSPYISPRTHSYISSTQDWGRSAKDAQSVQNEYLPSFDYQNLFQPRDSPLEPAPPVASDKLDTSNVLHSDDKMGQRAPPHVSSGRSFMSSTKKWVGEDGKHSEHSRSFDHQETSVPRSAHPSPIRHVPLDKLDERASRDTEHLHKMSQPQFTQPSDKNWRPSKQTVDSKYDDAVQRYDYQYDSAPRTFRQMRFVPRDKPDDQPTRGVNPPSRRLSASTRASNISQGSSVREIKNKLSDCFRHQYADKPRNSEPKMSRPDPKDKHDDRTVQSLSFTPRKLSFASLSQRWQPLKGELEIKASEKFPTADHQTNTAPNSKPARLVPVNPIEQPTFQTPHYPPVKHSQLSSKQSWERSSKDVKSETPEPVQAYELPKNRNDADESNAAASRQNSEEQHNPAVPDEAQVLRRSSNSSSPQASRQANSSPHSVSHQLPERTFTPLAKQLDSVAQQQQELYDASMQYSSRTEQNDPHNKLAQIPHSSSKQDTPESNMATRNRNTYNRVKSKLKEMDDCRRPSQFGDYIESPKPGDDCKRPSEFDDAFEEPKQIDDCRRPSEVSEDEYPCDDEVKEDKRSMITDPKDELARAYGAHRLSADIIVNVATPLIGAHRLSADEIEDTGFSSYYGEHRLSQDEVEENTGLPYDDQHTLEDDLTEPETTPLETLSEQPSQLDDRYEDSCAPSSQSVTEVCVSNRTSIWPKDKYRSFSERVQDGRRTSKVFNWDPRVREAVYTIEPDRRPRGSHAGSHHESHHEYSERDEEENPEQRQSSHEGSHHENYHEYSEKEEDVEHEEGELLHEGLHHSSHLQYSEQEDPGQEEGPFYGEEIPFIDLATPAPPGDNVEDPEQDRTHRCRTKEVFFEVKCRPGRDERRFKEIRGVTVVLHFEASSNRGNIEGDDDQDDGDKKRDERSDLVFSSLREERDCPVGPDEGHGS